MTERSIPQRVLRKVVGLFAVLTTAISTLTGAILSNPDFESGLSNWTGKGGSNLSLETSDVHEGVNSLRSSNRNAVFDGPSQNILSAVLSAGQGTYELGLFAKNLSSTSNLKPTIRLKYGGTNKYINFEQEVGTSWMEVNGIFELTWDGTLQEAEFYVANVDTSQNFLIDASSLSLEFLKGLDWYVSPNGDDSNSGASTSSPLKTIQAAFDSSGPGDVIHLMEGTYKASDYDSVQSELLSYSGVDYSLISDSIGEIAPSSHVLRIDKSGTKNAYITIKAFENDEVKLVFNGSYGINIFRASYIMIEGLEIVGASEDITYSMADKNRILRPRSNAFNGIGLQVRLSHHIIVRNCYVHHCPGAGIRADDSDYIFYENNVVSHCNWWTPSGSSAMVIAAADSFDNYAGTKIWIRKNIVHSNWNTQVFSLISRDPDDTSYGGPMHGSIDDGQGIYTTRNNGSVDVFGVPDGYAFGSMRIENNIVFNNGWGGLTYHKTDRGSIFNNTIIDNGVFPPGASRSGSNFNNSNDVDYFNNIITYDHGNPSFVFQSTGINITNNSYFGPSTSQVSGNTYDNYAARLNEFVDGTISFETPIGDARMESVFGVGNLPAPAIFSSLDLRLKAGASSIDQGIAVGGDYPHEDFDGYARSLSDLDLGAYDSDQSATAGYEDPRFLLAPQEGPGYITFEPYGFSKGATELLENTDFENGSNSWSAKGPCSISVSSTEFYSISQSLFTDNRSLTWHGPSQDVKSVLEDAGPGTYTLSGYFKNVANASTVKLTLRIKVGGVNTYRNFEGSVGTDWTQVEGDVELDWSGTLEEAEFYVANTDVDESFYADYLSVNRVVKVEAEDHTILGTASVSTDVNASGGEVVTGLGLADGSGIQILNTPAAKNLRVYLNSLDYGTLSIYVNGVHNKNVYFTPTSTMSAPGKMVNVGSVGLVDGDTLSIRSDFWDADANLDYLEFEY